ncbi:MAG: tRNA pseudouridine synthase B [uncultured bacterium]|nr:MAG: tRNA pseudouridine synthase B [uncultured bacterium]KKT76841.1 MAG: tRNA pseudouridine synthase B [Candidatus Peregrinibacteria bacterium GW2011_GWA2_44_7]
MNILGSSNGFLVVDKPTGYTSFDMVARARRAFGIKKIGHLGTLDPLATGALVLALGEATKLIEYLMKADKVYEARFELGKVSDTYDRDGSIQVVDPAPMVSLSQLQPLLEVFLGEIQQTPPIFSAIKVQGQRAYALARAGESVVLKPRLVSVHSIEILRFELPFVELRIHCGSGTYIRSLIHDVGQRLGCGALMTELRRLSVGSFSLGQSVPEENWPCDLVSLEAIVREWPSVAITEAQWAALWQGKEISVLEPPDSEGFPLAVFHEGHLVSVGRMAGSLLRPVKNFKV